MSDTSEEPNAPITAGLTELAGAMLATESLHDFLVQVARLAAASLPIAGSCGITVQGEGRPLTVASSDALAEELDEVQYGVDAGPCLDAMRNSRINSIADLSVEDRWPTYCKHALSQGVRASFSIPLRAGGDAVGALNLYSKSSPFDTSVRQHVSVFAAQAAAAITMTMRYADQVTLTEQLRTALTSRSVIDQAMGIIMGQRRCTPEEAFGVLRAASQRRNIRLRDVARDLVESATAS
jgi:GAF domain-containing protein